MADRILPYSEEAEKGALGSMLLEGTRVVPIAQRMQLPSEAFYVPAHRVICEVIYGIMEGARPVVDSLTVQEVLRQKEKLDEIGGGVFLHQLIDATPTATHAEYYLDIVRQKYILRRILATSRGIEDECYRVESGDVLLKDIPQRYIEIISEDTQEESNEAIMSQSIREWEVAAKGGKKAIGLETPWEKLTEILCGLEVGVTILAGRPSQGKTIIEDQISTHLAGQGIPVGRITLDCTVKELLQRALCRKAGVSLPKLKFGHAGESQRQQIREAYDLLKTYPMYFTDTTKEIRAICARARAWKMQRDIQLLTVDFLQLIDASDMGREQWQANARVSYVSKTLKALAIELKIPLLVLCQLSRAVEKDSRVPELSDLRDSGTIEQDAHKVIFVYKDDKKCKALEQEEPGKTKHLRAAWFDVMKNKDGETGRLPFWMRPHYFRFDEASEDFEEDIKSENG